MSATLASPPRTSDMEPHAPTTKDQCVAQEAFEANEHRDSDISTEASDCSAMEHELELEIVKRELSLVRERLAMTEEDNKTLRATLEDARICASADPYDWSHTYCCDAAGVNTAMDFAFVVFGDSSFDDDDNNNDDDDDDCYSQAAKREHEHAHGLGYDYVVFGGFSDEEPDSDDEVIGIDEPTIASPWTGRGFGHQDTLGVSPAFDFDFVVFGESRFDHGADDEYDEDASQAAESDDGESDTALDYDYVVFGGHSDDDSDDEFDVGGGDHGDHGYGHNDDDSAADEAIEGTFEFDSASSSCDYRDTCSAFVSTTTGCIYLDVTGECDWTQPRSSEVEMQPYFLV
ncbi:hypothetical protein ATCC90586_011979 [Pythium insidiosum]|nr:hypothetical protein ATCC90586_011979 [Pythium insidiosum]